MKRSEKLPGLVYVNKLKDLRSAYNHERLESSVADWNRVQKERDAQLQRCFYNISRMNEAGLFDRDLTPYINHYLSRFS